MFQLKRFLFVGLCALALLSACKNSNGATTEAAVSTTTPDAAPAPAAATLAANLTKFKEVELPFVVNTKTDLKSLTKFSDKDMDALSNDYGFTVSSENRDKPQAGFRAKIDSDRQIVAIIYESAGHSAVLGNVQFCIFKNDGTPVGETAEFTYLHSMSNQYAAGETHLDITIDADKITTKGKIVEMDPMGEKDNKTSDAPPTTTVIGAKGLPKISREF
jgi:hypothetical protein